VTTKETRALARLLFKCRVILASAKAFQDLFWDVMKAKHGQDFAEVAPQGSKGDGGNDGYLPAERHYYQLYAPISPKEKVTAAARKLSADFTKVKTQWGGTGSPGLRRFSFAFNDKYDGAPKEIELELNSLRATHQTIVFAHYCCRELETDFMGLQDTEWDRIIGMPVPDPSRLVNLDYSVLGEVIRFVLCGDLADSETRLDLPPELDQKIELNGLSRPHAVRVQNGALHAGHIDKYFSANTTFALAELRDHVVGHYETAKKVIRENNPPDGTRPIDALFTLFRHSLFPKGATAAAAIPVDAVIGYFFEACDIFDPKAEKELPGASP
jgi:hypothetical protein